MSGKADNKKKYHVDQWFSYFLKAVYTKLMENISISIL